MNAPDRFSWCYESSINHASLQDHCSDHLVLTSSEEHCCFQMVVHDTASDWVRELEYPLTDTNLVQGPLSQSLVIRAWEHPINFMWCLQLIDLVWMSKQGKEVRVHIFSLDWSCVPAAYQTIAKTREHKLVIKLEASDWLSSHDFLLVLLTCIEFERVLWVELVHLCRTFDEWVELFVLWSLDLNVTHLWHLHDSPNWKSKWISGSKITNATYLSRCCQLNMKQSMDLGVPPIYALPKQHLYVLSTSLLICLLEASKTMWIKS